MTKEMPKLKEIKIQVKLMIGTLEVHGRKGIRG
jgi:hypothetical protein